MSCRILVVEDEAIIAANLEETLLDLGHSVVGSSDNGLGAIGLAKTLLPDIIFMDIKLKGTMDGIETAFLIEGVVEKAIAIVFATSSPPHRLKHLLGKHVWLLKPYTLREVEEAIVHTH